MKRVVFVFAFMVVAITTFADWVYTSEGYYDALINYVGQNNGQHSAKILISNGYTHTKLSAAQVECVRTLLNRYQSSMGDTYFITIAGHGNETIQVIVEYSSYTKWVYWAYMKYL
jgi:type IV pilus biogenesis protein CpaD/CtpE